MEFKLALYKHGQGGFSTKKIKKVKKKEPIKMPKNIPTNIQQLAKCMRISYFRDIFKHTTLSTEGV